MTTPNQLAEFIEEGLRRGVKEDMNVFLVRRGFFWFSPICGCALGLAAVGKMGARQALKAYRISQKVPAGAGCQAISEIVDIPTETAVRVSSAHSRKMSALEIASRLRSGNLTSVFLD